MRILITGGAGFVGSNLCIKLKTDYPEWTVIAFDNLRRRGSELNLRRFAQAGIEFVHGDIRNEHDLDAIEFDLLIEASAEPSVLAGVEGGRKYLVETNFNGLVNAAEACLNKQAKIIFLSSSRIYPMEPINALPFEENETRYSLAEDFKGIAEEFTKDGARTLYGATKFSAEMLIEEYGTIFGLQAVVNRCGVIAGPWQFGKVDQGFMTLWVAQHYFKKPLTIFGNGKQVRDVLHIDDLYRLIKMQINDFKSFAGQLFNVGGGNASSVSLLELEAICENLVGPTVYSFSEERMLDLKYFVMDHSKVTDVCSWKPEKGIHDIIIDIKIWIQDNKEELKWIFA